ncbi:MAG: MFS transporter, partial [Betaproteobacteria bacterium AqS2]|nr:MFS transporter [Betaproteobacteria bacterium AqS2]
MNAFALLLQRRFLPLFVVQFGGALNDNVLRNALVAMITFGALGAELSNRALYIQLTVGFFMLPYFLFAASAGSFADRCPDRALAIRWIKLAEIGTVCVALAGFAFGSVGALLLAVFLAGTQSALFGPFKYAVLPDLLEADELPRGNGLVSASTFLAIIAGVYLGTELGARPGGAGALAATLLLIALAGFVAAWRLLPLPNAAPQGWLQAFEWNIFRAIAVNIRACRTEPWTLSLICMISWFWVSGAIISTQLPLLVRDVYGYDHTVYLGLLLLICLGVAAGSLIAGRLPRGATSNRPVPFAIAVAAFCCMLPVYPDAALPPAGEELPGLAAFLAVPAHYAGAANIFVLSMAMGFYIVPLYVTMQLLAPARQRGRVIAANNVFNAVFIVLGVVLAGLLVGAGADVGVGIDRLYLTIGMLGFVVAVIGNRLVIPNLNARLAA